MKVVVTGAAGMLGRDMVAEFQRRGHDVIALDRARLDITDLHAVRAAIGSLKPDLVVNCAAYTDVDKAESEPELAMAVNGLGPRNLALACEDHGVTLMHISTDYVFDGEKAEPYEIWDPPNPINVYGKTKMWGENFVRSIMIRYYLVRTSWLFGHGRPNFITFVVERVHSGQGIKAVVDQFGSPTYSRDLARACADLVASGCYGVYHVTNQGFTSWYGVAEQVLLMLGAPSHLESVAVNELGRPAKRPRNCRLDPKPLAETVGYLLRGWSEALRDYLAVEGLVGEHL